MRRGVAREDGGEAEGTAGRRRGTRELINSGCGSRSPSRRVLDGRGRVGSGRDAAWASPEELGGQAAGGGSQGYAASRVAWERARARARARDVDRGFAATRKGGRGRCRARRTP